MARRSRRIALALAGIGGLLLITLAVYLLGGGKLALSPASIRDILPHGSLRIGVDASNPPFAVATADDLFGLEVDLGQALAEELGVPVQFVNMTFDGIYDSLKADQVDMVIATLSIDPLRTAEVRYTRPYFNAGLVLVSPVTTPIRSMADLSGYRLAYEFGSTADSEARRWLRRILPFETQPYELPAYALDAVRLGEADVALVDATSAHLYLREHDWPVNLDYATVNPYVIALREDRAPLWQMVDQALGQLQANGILEALINEWL